MLVKPIEVWYPKRLDDMVGALKQSRFGCFPGRRPRRCRVGRCRITGPAEPIRGRTRFGKMNDIGERVKKIVVEHLGVEPDKVTDAASFIDDLGADSLDTVELVMA